MAKMTDSTQGKIFPSGPSGAVTLREFIEVVMHEFGDKYVREFTWEMDLVDVTTTASRPRVALTGEMRLEFKIGVRAPRDNPYVDQSGDYESTPDLTALFEGGPDARHD